MAKPYDFGEVGLDVEVGRSPRATRPNSGTPFHIVVLGDFSGRSSRREKRSGPELAGSRLWQVDRDDLDDVMERLGVELELPVVGRIRFGSIDEFHPDSLYRRLEIFRKLREAGQGIGRATKPPEPPISRRPASSPEPNLGLDGLLDQAVEETVSQAEGRPAETKDDFQAWLKDTVAPHTEAAPDPRRAEVKALVEQAATAQMRAVMHFPAFQQLEAAWRAVFFLVRRVETGAMLKIHLLDMSKEELGEDLRNVKDLSDAGLVEALDPKNDEEWSLLVGNYTFGPSVEDISLLTRLGTISQAFQMPFLAGGSPLLAGVKSLVTTPDPRDWDPEGPKTWRVLRQHRAASHIGLAAPRFLLRLPYGAETDPCEEFPFEEFAGVPEHGRYLWGNPAFLCACLLAESFNMESWNFRPGMHRNVERLPLHLYREAGQTHATPCAEVVMSERMAEALLDRGLMPVASIRDTDEARVVRFQSAADPPSGLGGKWA